jgi:integrase
MNLNEAVQLYLDTFTKRSTADTYQKALITLMEVVGPARRIEEIGPADLVRFHTHISHQDYAPATARQRITSVKTFFSWLHKMELIEKNPARVIKARRLQRPRTRDKAMTDDELRLILEYTRFRSRRDHALVLFLADTGCRIGGAATLREHEIDWDKREAEVTEKGDKTRRVRFGVHTANVLRRYLIWRKATGGTYVFSEDGTPIKSETLSQRIRRACHGLRKQGVEIRILSAHSIRHRKGHQLADARVAPPIAASALGHESVMTTLEHYYPDDWESAAQVLDELSLDDAIGGSQD